MTRNARELAVMESPARGKTVHYCETVGVPEAASRIGWRGEPTDKIHFQVSPASDDRIAMILREPAAEAGMPRGTPNAVAEPGPAAGEPLWRIP
jgi:gamma-glutamyl-gamma-aminobutyraldehyde dehydrogenase